MMELCAHWLRMNAQRLTENSADASLGQYWESSFRYRTPESEDRCTPSTCASPQLSHEVPSARVGARLQGAPNDSGG
jgi:hypothetical protein